MSRSSTPVRTPAAIAMLWAGLCSAQGQVSLLAVPLDLDPSPTLLRQAAVLQTAYFAALEAHSGTIVPARREVELIMKELTRHDFRDADAALADAARAGGTLYALFASLHANADGTLLLGGRIVRDDGRLMGVAAVSAPKDPRSLPRRVSDLLVELLGQLHAGGLPSFKEVVTAEAPRLEPLASVAPVPSAEAMVDSSPGRPLRPGPAVTVIGLGVAAAGGVVAIIGATQGARLTPDTQGAVPMDQLPALRTARVLTTGGLVAGGVGVAALAIGVTLWVTGPSAPVTVSCRLTPGGAAMTFGGGF